MLVFESIFVFVLRFVFAFSFCEWDCVDSAVLVVANDEDAEPEDTADDREDVDGVRLRLAFGSLECSVMCKCGSQKQLS